MTELVIAGIGIVGWALAAHFAYQSHGHARAASRYRAVTITRSAEISRLSSDLDHHRRKDAAAFWKGE